MADFRKYVRPIANPILSDFCVKLTGISQNYVDEADTFPEVFQQLEEFLETFMIENHCVLVTDSPYDVYKFLLPACLQHDVPFPKWGKSWINLRKIFSAFYKTERMNIAGMLQHLGLDFDGRLHCGLDDAKNIAKILLVLLKDGCEPSLNEGLDRDSHSLIKKQISPKKGTTETLNAAMSSVAI